jgi:hypothetical protein
MEGENLKLALREVGKLIRKSLKQNALNPPNGKKGFKASGKLDRSFKYRVENNELYIFGEKYANALSDGIKTDNTYNKSNEQFRKSIIDWAKSKGITPKRDKKGRFTSYMSMANAITKSIRKKGISKRYNYKGSGFIQAAQDQTREQIKTILKEGYRKDILLSLNKLKSIN